VSARPPRPPRPSRPRLRLRPSRPPPPPDAAPLPPPAARRNSDACARARSNLEDNKLVKLPNSLCSGACVNLKGLYLQNNKLTALGFKPSLMPAMRKMSIAGNDFSAAAKAQAQKDMADAGVVEAAAPGP
jgi:hypothetical protein